MESRAEGKISQVALLQKERGRFKATPNAINAFILGQSIYKFKCNNQKRYKIRGNIASNRLELLNLMTNPIEDKLVFPGKKC